MRPRAATAALAAAAIQACAVWPGAARSDATTIDLAEFSCAAPVAATAEAPELARSDGGWFVRAPSDQAFVVFARRVPGDNAALPLAACQGTCWVAHPEGAPVLAISLAALDGDGACEEMTPERYVERPTLLAVPAASR